MKGKHIVIFYFIILQWLCFSCASLGNPDGGPYDETPPQVVACSPADRATNVGKKKVSILFNEYIKLENASEKVIVSPPQKEMANIRADGKQIRIDLYDELLPNTTYTIDFSDAIEDNNEGNPMGHYTYSFSTGEEIDTMEVSGIVLNSEDLEPIKGVLVGLYPADSTFSDTLFRTTPFKRVSRTNGSGRFTIKGVKHGDYRVFALKDADGDFVFSQKNEVIAFDSTIIHTSSKPDVRMDTIWRDSTRYDSICVVPYTHYLPDDIVLMAFLEEGQEQHLLKTERPDPDYFRFYFTAPSDSLPKIEGLNFDERCLVTEASQKNDTITYWVTDTLYSYQQDTLKMVFTYLETDTTGILVSRSDTLEMAPKITQSQRRKEKQKQIDEWEKAREKKQKKSKKPLPYEENPFIHTFMDISIRPAGSIDPNQNIRFVSKQPYQKVDTTAMHFCIKKDSNWIEVPFLFIPNEENIREYILYAEWEPKAHYRFEADSAAFSNVLGHVSKPISQEFRVRALEEFGSIFITVSLPDTTDVIVQLLNRSGKVVREQLADDKGRTEFYYMKPGEYYVRCYLDANRNSKWDTGNYSNQCQAEEVFYFPKPLGLKAQWDLEQEWDVRGIRRDKQKPIEITKQKPEKEKQIKSRNKEREEEKRKGKSNTNQSNNDRGSFGRMPGFR